MQLESSRVIVTGAAQGMGAAAVRGLAAAGASVAAVDIADEAGREVAREASQSAKGQIHYYHADVGVRGEVEAAFSEAQRDLGGIDVLVHCAGIARVESAASITEQDIELVVRTNLIGTIVTNQVVYGYMEARGGAILNFGSDSALLSIPGTGAYAASKGGVMAWTRTVAAEWAQYGIRVNSVVPAMKTPMTNEGRADPRRSSVYAKVALGGDLGDVDRDFAPVIVFLAGDGARFITGQIIAVNGGLGMVR